MLPRRAPAPARGRRRLLVALAVAVGVHLGLGVLPFDVGLEPQERVRVTRLHLAPPLEATPPAPVPPVVPPTASPPPPPPPRPRPAPQARRAPTPTPPPASAPPEAPPAAEVAPEVPRRLALPTPSLEPAPEAAPEGTPPPWRLSQRRPDEDLSEGAEGRIAGRVTAWVEDAKAMDRVRVGLVDPYFVELKQGMREAFEPDWSDFDSKDQGGVADTLRSWLRDYQATAERYGETGSPYHEGEAPSGPHVPELHDLPTAGNDSPDDPARQAMAAALWRDLVHGKAGGVEVATIVRVTQAPDGRLTSVRIEQGSGRAAYDALVLSAVDEAVGRLAPPARAGEGVGLTGDEIVSVWRFRTRFGVVPLGVAGTPSMGCDIGGECYWPFKRLVRPHLELLAVY